MISGLKFLYDEFAIMHRDVRPSNIILNKDGQVKLCDVRLNFVSSLSPEYCVRIKFGVSGQLSKSLAKTYIGCQSYMAPERIQDACGGTYTVAADIYSLGLCLWETAMGRYPFPPDKYDSLFAQLCAIITEQLPALDHRRFSEKCRDFIYSMLRRNPQERPSYAQLLETEFINCNSCKDHEIRDWVRRATV